MMNKEQKKNYITEMTAQFENSKAVMVTHYQGLTMPQLDELRSKMREHGIVFKITKNRITKLALEKTKCKDLSKLFTGPTAVAFGEDAIISARILSKFAKILLTLPAFCLLDFDYKFPACCRNSSRSAGIQLKRSIINRRIFEEFCSEVISAENEDEKRK